MKTCIKCLLSKSIKDFHLDKKNKDGRSARCKPCKNGSRIIHTKEVKPQKIKVQQVNVLDELADKFGSTLTITIQKDRKTILQVHGNPQTTYKARTPGELLSVAL